MWDIGAQCITCGAQTVTHSALCAGLLTSHTCTTAGLQLFGNQLSRLAGISARSGDLRRAPVQKSCAQRDATDMPEKNPCRLEGRQGFDQFNYITLSLSGCETQTTNPLRRFRRGFGQASCCFGLPNWYPLDSGRLPCERLQSVGSNYLARRSDRQA